MFSVCNPLKMCPNGGGGIVGSGLPVDLPSMTPKQLLNFRRQLSTENKNKKNSASAASAEATGTVLMVHFYQTTLFIHPNIACPRAKVQYV